jgi:hypothetical protein
LGPFPSTPEGAPSGNEPLRALHDLDIGDKHVAVVQAAASSATPSLPFGKPTVSRVPGATRLTFTADFRALVTAPIDLTGFPRDPDPNLETVGKVVGSEIALVIASGLPLAGRPVIEALGEMGDAAEQIVQALEAYCGSRR